MPLAKKIFFLFIALVILIAYSVSTFNYKTISTVEKNYAISFSNEDFMFGEYADKIILKINEFKSTILNELGLNDLNNNELTKEYLSLELVKNNGIISMNGVFKDENQAKIILDLLNINRNGKYVFKENIIIDNLLVNKLTLIIDPFKELFIDGSKLSIVNGEVLLEGELKDSKFRSLLDSIIKKSKLTIITLVKEPFQSKTEKIIDKIQNQTIILENDKNIKPEDRLNKLEKTIPIVDDLDNKSKLVQDVQNTINELSSDNKITFEKRSTKITVKSKELIKKIATILLSDSRLEIEIAGHTDSIGKASINNKISQDRANNVKTTLMSLGVNPKRIKAVGYGEDFPIVKNDLQGRSEINRRVEFIIGEVK